MAPAPLRTGRALLALAAPRPGRPGPAAPRAAEEHPVSVTGTVRDATGAAVPRALVSLLDAQRATVASGRTGDEGRYSVGAPAPGRYIAAVRGPRLRRAHRHRGGAVKARPPSSTSRSRCAPSRRRSR